MIVVLADDLTGAAEIAGVCLRYQLRVAFGIENIPKVDTDVVVIATDSRSLDEHQAFDIHKNLASRIVQEYPDAQLFKKCDSVLRGFVLTELLAVLQVSNYKHVILQPANPATRRCIINGIYTIENVEIHKTGFAADPDFPAKVSNVKKMLLERSTYVKNASEIHTSTSTWRKSGFLIPDCNSIKDLQTSLSAGNNESFFCGSAAFFEQLLVSKGLVKGVIINSVNNLPSKFLLLCGSAHLNSKSFIRKLAKKDVEIQSFPHKLASEKLDKEVLDQWISELSTILLLKNQLVLTISDSNISFPNSSNILKHRFATVVKRLLQCVEVREIFIEGGATAYEILKIMHWDTLNPENELSPGVVRMEIASFQGSFVTLKPGSYEWPENYIK